MNPEIDYWMQTERRKDEIRAAAHQRLVKQAMIDRRPQVTIRPAVYYLTLALVYLGEHMLDWSARLQCRYHVLIINSNNQPEPCV